MLLFALSLASIDFYNFEGEAVLEFVFSGVFLHDFFGNDGVFHSLHQGVLDHLIDVGGLANW